MITYYFILMGATSIISQLIFFRELSITFLGNEIIYAIGFLFWFLGIALGSLYKGKKDKKAHLDRLTNISIFLIIYLPLLLVLVRALPLLNSFTGEIAPLTHLLLLMPLILLPLCFMLGLKFAWGTHYFIVSKKIKTTLLTHQAYIYETIGFILGGSLYYVLFIQLPSTFSIAILTLLELALILTLNKKAIDDIFARKLMKQMSVLFLLLISFFAGMIIFCHRDFDRITHGWRFNGQELLDTENSIYGNLTVTSSETQKNFYENGVLVGTDQDQFENEILAHLTLTAHQQPSSVLVIGTAFNGLLEECLKHPVSQLTYIELDTKLIDLARSYLGRRPVALLGHPNVSIIAQDGYEFLAQSESRYDVILLNIPDPSNFFLARYYTEDFFQLARDHLNEGGLLTTSLNASPNYLNRGQALVGATVYQGLRTAFPRVEILADDEIIFYGFSEQETPWSKYYLSERLNQRQIETEYVDKNYIFYRFEKDSNTSVLDQLTSQAEPEDNTNMHPISYYYSTIAWGTLSSQKIADLFLYLLEHKWVVSGLIITALATVVFVLLRKVRNGAILFSSMLTASATTMVMEIIIISLFQILFGYIYSMLGIIITVLMIGMLLGNLLIKDMLVTVKFDHRRALSLAHTLMALLLGCFIGLVLMFQSSQPGLLAFTVIPTFTLLMGVLEGCIFPLTNTLYLEQHTNIVKKTGIIYSADVIGAGLGTIFISLFLMPLLGIAACVICLLVLNLLAAGSTLYLSAQKKA